MGWEQWLSGLRRSFNNKRQSEDHRFDNYPQGFGLREALVDVLYLFTAASVVQLATSFLVSLEEIRLGLSSLYRV